MAFYFFKANNVILNDEQAKKVAEALDGAMHVKRNWSEKTYTSNWEYEDYDVNFKPISAADVARMRLEEQDKD